MIVWRISRYRSLDGIGGLSASGRWHTKGHRITYASEHPGTAALEWLVHLDVSPEEIPSSFPFLKIDVPPGISTGEITEADLPGDWRKREDVTRTRGDQWLSSCASAVLFVPSVLLPARNVLLNPMHPDCGRITVLEALEAPFDRRLL